MTGPGVGVGVGVEVCNLAGEVTAEAKACGVIVLARGVEVDRGVIVAKTLLV
jgi:hypothetical protein